MSEAINQERLSQQTRTLLFNIEERSRDAGEDIPVVISSDAIVDMSDGPEILVHSSDAVDLRRAPLPIIAAHKGNQVNVGVVRDLQLVGGVARGMARFGSRPEAAGYRDDVLNGIIRSVSVGYQRIKGKVRGDGVLVTSRWMPSHVAMVAEPADVNAGFFRSKGGGDFELEKPPDPPDQATQESTPEARQVRASSVSTPASPAAIKGGTKVSDESNAAAGASADEKTTVITGGDNSRSGPNGVEMEKLRKRAIENFAKANRIEGRTVDYWINSGISLDQVSDDILRILEERGKTNPQSAAALGLSKKEAESFSLTRAIKACAENNWTNAPFELNCSRQVAAQIGKTNDAQRFFVPFEVLQRQLPDSGRRDLNTTLPSGGGYLVSTENNGFVELLRNRSVLFSVGARRLSGLVGNVSIPKQTGSGTAYWLGTEATSITESQQAFQQLAMTPKTVGAYTEISRNLLLQSSPAAEGIVNEDLAKTVGIAVDLAGLAGTGVSGQPIGLVNTSGIGSVTGTSFSYAKALEFQTDVAAANVVPARGAYVTTPAAAAILMQKQRFTSTDTPLWVGNVWDGNVVGFPAMSTNQLADGMIFGDWNELVIGEWGVLEVEVNPYANFTAGIIGIRAMYSMDVGVRRPLAFSYASSITA